MPVYFSVKLNHTISRKPALPLPAMEDTFSDTLFLLIGGIYSMLTLPIDAVPDSTNNQIQIVTVLPTLALQEVQQLIPMPGSW